jgi:hypothetical protein
MNKVSDLFVAFVIFVVIEAILLQAPRRSI